ncbi:MAG TPA: cupredoxin family copper-binding protein [Telluria sp.]|nr:cupredoxin family copper-binding protein [Telluria sp.]
MRTRHLAALAAVFASALARAGSAHVVVIDAMEFTPRTLEVRAGDRVTWKNRDPFPHTVASATAGFTSPEIGTGKSWSMVVRSQRDADYICTLHPTMKGRLVVRTAPAKAPGRPPRSGSSS